MLRDLIFPEFIQCSPSTTTSSREPRPIWPRRTYALAAWGGQPALVKKPPRSNRPAGSAGSRSGVDQLAGRLAVNQMKMKVRILLPEQEFQILDNLIDEVVGSDKDSHSCAFSSAEEQSLDVGKVGGSIPSRRTGAVWSASFGMQDGPHQISRTPRRPARAESGLASDVSDLRP